MATSSSSSSAVDLIEAADAEHDDAMSKLFFSDSSSAGPVLSWPVALEIDSALKSQHSLVALCSKHDVPSELTPVSAQHLGWRACTPPPVGSNKMCVYAAALNAGLRFPLHEFYTRVLSHYRLAPSQLTPNSWSYLAAFLLLCQEADVEPMVLAFRYFFTICAHSHQGKPTGWHHFQPYHDEHRRRRRLFTGNLPSWSGWKSRFFFLESPTRWNCRVKWGKPKRMDARRVQRTDMVIETLKLKQEEMGEERIGGSIDIKVFLANREMPVGDPTSLAPLQSALKAEAGAAAAAGAAGDVAAAAEDASTRKRSRLSPAAVLAQPQPLPTSAPAGFSPIRASITGGCSGHIPPPGLPPIRASRTGGSTSEHIPSMGVAPIRASITGGSSSRHTPPPHQWSFGDSTTSSSDALQLQLQLRDARDKASQQAAMIAQLNQELQMVTTWNTQWQKEVMAAGEKHAAETTELITRLWAANERNKHLNEELVRLDKEYVAERDQLIGRLQLHAAESARLKQEFEAKVKQLMEEFAEEAGELKDEGYTTGAMEMREFALTKYQDVINPDELTVELLREFRHQGAPPVVAGEDQ